MTARSIILRDWEVRAILGGRKTQLRRPIKPQPADDIHPHVFPSGARHWISSLPHKYGANTAHHPPFDPGDRLWVREAFGIAGDLAVDPCVNYRADGMQFPIVKFENRWIVPSLRFRFVAWDADWPRMQRQVKDGWRRAQEMPSWASRITLEVERVWVKRVQAVSDSDAESEGAIFWGQESLKIRGCDNCREIFAKAWDSTYANRGFGWDTNPWVWACAFRRVE